MIGHRFVSQGQDLLSQPVSPILTSRAILLAQVCVLAQVALGRGVGWRTADGQQRPDPDLNDKRCVAALALADSILGGNE